ncbi:MAG: hypothetical protein EOO46_24065, partial [Flavobacterium sp.]
MTIKEKLTETHEWIQKSYGFGELFFKGQLEYHIDTFKSILLAYGKFADLQYHVEKEYLGLVDAAYGNIRYLSERNYSVGNNVENNYLNMVKSNMSQAYWLFFNFVQGKRDGFL